MGVVRVIAILLRAFFFRCTAVAAENLAVHTEKSVRAARGG